MILSKFKVNLLIIIGGIAAILSLITILCGALILFSTLTWAFYFGIVINSYYLHYRYQWRTWNKYYYKFDDEIELKAIHHSLIGLGLILGLLSLSFILIREM